MKTGLLFLLMFVVNSVQAVVLSGEAYGPTHEEARKAALAALAESMMVEIKSEFHSEQDSSGYTDANKKVRATSDLPLLGADPTVIRKGEEYYCTVLMNSERALPLYNREVDRLVSSINSLDRRQKSLKDRQARYRVLRDLLNDIEQFDKYTTVAMMLGAARVDIIVNERDVRSEMMTIESVAPSLDVAVSVLSRDLPNTTYIVQAPLLAGSRHATPFARVIRDKLAGKVRSTENKQEYTSYLKGSYEILKDGIAVSYRAVDYRGETVASRVVKLSPSAYKGIKVKPDALEFDQLLHDGFVRSNDFRAELNTNLGKESLLFHPGQSVELFARINAPGYFYIVSHNTTSKQSYLLELNDVKGKRAFVRYVNADDANRWLSLGEFEVSEPFGSENLQLVASSVDLVSKLPAVAYDKKTELYIVQSTSMEDAVIKTRGLKPKRKKGIKSSEATLSFTTMPRGSAH